MRLRLASFASFSAVSVWLLVGSAFVVEPQPVNAQSSTCYVWSGQIALQDAVSTYACVEIAPGEWQIASPIEFPLRTFSMIRGADRNGSVVRASCSFSNVKDGRDVRAMFAASGVTGIILTNFTVDAACLRQNGVRVPQSTGGVGANGMLIDGMVIKGAKCWGVAIDGPGMVVRNNIIAENGSTCPVSPPGAGIYARPQPVHGAGIAPVIHSNEIRDNIGPGLDVDGVWHGSFANNTVTGNSHWAAVSLYGSSHWNITGNVIVHPLTTDVQPYFPQCAGGPIGNGSAGIFLCQTADTDPFDGHLVVTNYNVIANNVSSGRYGILSIGNDEATPYWAPRLNVFFNNNVIGSWHGCADDFTPGQYFSDDNRWNNNNCAGTPNTGPTYF